MNNEAIPVLSLEQTAAWLEQALGRPMPIRAGQLCLLGADGQETLRFEALPATGGVALMAPVAKPTALSAIRWEDRRLDLHLLHLCAEVEALGGCRIARGPGGTLQVVLTELQASDATILLAICNRVLESAQQLARAIEEAWDGIADEDDTLPELGTLGLSRMMI